MYLVIQSFVDNLKRKKTLLILQIMFLLVAVVLYVIHNVLPDFAAKKWIETIIVVLFYRGGLSLDFAIIFTMGAE